MSAASTAEGHQLFRPEALEAQRQALLGRILINTPLAHWLVAATAAALFAQIMPQVNAFSAAICRVDGNQPTRVCAAPGVMAANAGLWGTK
ncbi:hypothetical protein [Metallibacterium sp.]|uniref:hypothetical protein n=1 Tax=Metallibacterium sp. TaxID=2940281 RepID=UPI0026235803|nr:hypothetical protein [Metallibacterium sp.]